MEQHVVVDVFMHPSKLRFALLCGKIASFTPPSSILHPTLHQMLRAFT